MRTYVADLAGGTVTTAVQMQEARTLKMVTVSVHSAAAGKLELSLSASSQIGTAQPTSDVIMRLNQSGTAGDQMINVPITLSVKAFQTLYFHQTGTGNLATVTLQ